MLCSQISLLTLITSTALGAINALEEKRNDETELISRESGLWTVSLTEHARMHKGKRIVVGKELIIENNNLRTEWIQSAAWTLGEVLYDERVVGQLSGASGSVVQWGGRDEGTGHGYEYLQSLRIHLNGRVIDIIESRPAPTPQQEAREKTPWLDEAPLTEELPVISDRVILEKHSWFGPFEHRTQVEFLPKKTGFTITHHYRFAMDFGEGWTGYRYVFMRMMPTQFTRFALFADGKWTPIQTIDPEKNTHQLFNQSLQAIACYNLREKVGLLFVTPQQYANKHHLLFRKGKDIKFRSMLFYDGGYQAGDELEFTLEFIPFTAAENDWKKTAEAALEKSLSESSP